ncbi:MAG: hypothetical protein GWN84_01005 [Gammaproteobacteria bacterium]|nr:hypothetical protein [Gammaproteobacteria bacterium]NIR81775.1 hypothetical protein [Gammaproteobacteria bacterium]NIR88578.1 hypothetical protein [Gammaproteobacteria bacterium]NIU02882.1 hypothetical protein [Gammaproteobacteria bacterium]NIV50404.1 hypothetical protein [Gammaproteobacteria bacterium]
MSEEILGERRKGLEEEFFARQNAKLRQELHEKAQLMERKQALSAASGITDEAVLEHLLALDVSAETVAAFSLVPLVAVAWADGEMDPREREAVLAATRDATGCAPDSEVYRLVEGWLEREPGPALMRAWKAYTAAMVETLGAEARGSLKAQILGRARRVAEAAGGFMGLGGKTSKSEEAVLSDIERAFG